jgi:hypothetical protein
MRTTEPFAAEASTRTRSRRARAAAGACAALGLAALLLPSPALAFCRTGVCPDTQETSAVCTPPQPSGCSVPVIPLVWPSPCVSYSIQEDASSQLSLAETEAIFEQAFAAWTQAECDGVGAPRIELSYTGPVACDEQEYNKTKRNANIIMFRDDGWPYEGSANTLALTTVTYNKNTGDIYDADMELNSFDVEFSTSDAKISFDLLSVATHEAGHFLGLSHSQESEATMYADYRPGTTWLRDLHDDDRAGICAAYPPGEPIKACDPTPRHGFSSQCAVDQPKEETSGCALAPASVAPASAAPLGGGRGAGLPLAALAALLGAAARRASRGGAGRVLRGGAGRPSRQERDA